MAERGTGFPRINLSTAVQIMDAASKFGKVWKKDTFATYGGKSNAGSATSGAFKSRLAALKEFGLIRAEGDDIYPTDLANQITKPISEEERLNGIRNAFLSVGTFSDLYTSLEGGAALPKARVVEYAVHNLGVSRESKDKFISSFVESGKYVGIVDFSKDSDVLTLIKSSPIEEAASLSGTSELSDSTTNTDSQVANFVNGFNAKAATAIKNGDFLDNATMNEQGVNHSGNGWSLTVLVKSSHRLPANLRKAIRDLLESADEVADSFYELEKEDR